MTDAVAIALVTIIPPTVTSIAGIVMTILTRRQVKHLRRETKHEAKITRAYVVFAVQSPDDLPRVDGSGVAGYDDFPHSGRR